MSTTPELRRFRDYILEMTDGAGVNQNDSVSALMCGFSLAVDLTHSHPGLAARLRAQIAQHIVADESIDADFADFMAQEPARLDSGENRA